VTATSDTSQVAAEALMQFLYQAPIGLVQTTLDGTITMINPMSAQLLMPLAAGGELSNLFDVLHAAAPQLRAGAAAAAWPGGTVCDGLRLPVNGGAGKPEAAGMLSIRLLRLDADTLMASVADITAEVRQERERVATQLRVASRIDPLTALPNRSVALERIDAALARPEGADTGGLAVLLINCDRFSRVNVTLGQAAGDEFLRLMATRLHGALRQRDTSQPTAESRPTAARLGVDEFVVVLDGGKAGLMATAVAQRLVEALGQPFSLGATPVHSSVSVGVVLGTEAGADAETVLQDASLAMREAKRQGGGRFCVFEAGMKTRAQRRASLESELRQALAEGQLFVVYQPIVHLQGAAAAGVAGVEALVRWRHPVRGLIPPLEFIGVAEETGLIVPLGQRVLDIACRQFAQWQQALGPRAPRVLSVNLSRAQILQGNLHEQVREALDASGLAPGCLQLEITESLAAEDPNIQHRLQQLKRLGVLLALDDFGTGYSSLSSLHQWPVDVIKIDRSFVSQIDTSAHHRVLVEATVMVARSLGMQTVAEGVETEAQAQVLSVLHCDKAQGYLFARPLDEGEATAWLQADHPGLPGAAAQQAGQPKPACPLPSPAIAERLLRQLEETEVGVGLFDPAERLAYANHSFRRSHCQGLGPTPTWEEVMRQAHRQHTGLLIEDPDIDRWIARVRQHYRREPRRVFESDFTDGRWMRVTEETSADGWQLSVMSEVTSLKVNEADLRLARDTALVASITDPLTGLPNRRHVFDRMNVLLTQVMRLRLPLTVAVIDIDLFKQVNDRHGHAVGDSVLVRFAQTFGSVLRQGDMLARLGGEEFLLVLPQGGREGAAQVLARARAALQAEALVPGQALPHVGFSAGVALAQPGDTPDTLWQRADRGLLAAKAAGRGQDVFVPAPDAAADLMERLRGKV
jgi:diguanylate cyclase (GGDEF)-like protein